jgi:hypothetical protein
LTSLGFLAELIIAYQARDSDTYSIAERTRAAEAPANRRQTALADRTESPAP